MEIIHSGIFETFAQDATLVTLKVRQFDLIGTYEDLYLLRLVVNITASCIYC